MRLIPLLFLMFVGCQNFPNVKCSDIWPQSPCVGKVNVAVSHKEDQPIQTLHNLEFRIEVLLKW